MAVSIRQLISDVWAKTGARTDPGSTKTSTGFIEEIPPYQWQNWWENRVDEALRTCEQLGIWPWNTGTPYEIDGHTMGTDGVLYRSLVAANTGNDPVTDGGTNWISALFKAVSIAADGYITLNTRPALTIQWGTAGPVSQNGTLTVNLPVTYGTAHLLSLANSADDTTNAAGRVHALPLSTSQIKLLNSDGTWDADIVHWLSLGY